MAGAYASGPSQVPLIGETIGANLEATVDVDTPTFSGTDGDFDGTLDATVSGLTVGGTPATTLTGADDGEALRATVQVTFDDQAANSTMDMATVLDDLGVARAGDAGAVNQLARQVGGALGVAVVGSLFGALLGPFTTTGATRGALALCGVLALAAALAALRVRPPAPAAPRP